MKIGFDEIVPNLIFGEVERYDASWYDFYYCEFVCVYIGFGDTLQLFSRHAAECGAGFINCKNLFVDVVIVHFRPTVDARALEEQLRMIENVVHPSLEALENGMHANKMMGGVIAGVRTGVFVMDAASHEAVGEYLRSLPFWGTMKWTVEPLQSMRSAVEQDRAAFKKAREMSLGHK